MRAESRLRQGNIEIKTWPQFGRHIRSQGLKLLQSLDQFPNSVLVTGCQRSGTTMLARVITQSDGMVEYQFSDDDERDAALILSGYIDHEPQGRYCFQTTYVDERFPEYFEHSSEHKLIWVLRNPQSVVYSMLYNWPRFALNELFDRCGSTLLEGKDAKRHQRFGRLAISRLHRACLSYNAKTLHAFKLKENLQTDQLMIVDYDELVSKKTEFLPKVFEFINLDYKDEYANTISSRSVGKSQRLSDREKNRIESICIPMYERAKTLLTL